MIFQIKTHLCHQKSLTIASDSDKIEVEPSSTPTSTTLSTSRSEHDDYIEVSQAGSTGTSVTTDLTLPVNSSNISSVNIDASCSIRQSEVEIAAENENLLDYGKMLQCTKDEETKAKDQGLWLDYSADDVAYWVACGPTDCQHHNRPFDKFCWTFNSGKPVSYCLQKLFFSLANLLNLQTRFRLETRVGKTN
ncbi:uncharacterized protein LOC143253073 [Tachypleus tridentatus]|uniref:uncharacterized protein LOC143253073 n=1 Tax=Tachypleus tridentatus TaxID=6853 RepID=UPI003FD3F11D